MTIPTSDQTVHLMNWLDIVRVRWSMRWHEGRNAREMALYTTDDLRHLTRRTVKGSPGFETAS